MSNKNDEKLLAEMEEELENGYAFEEEIFHGEIDTKEYHESVSHESVSHEVDEEGEEESQDLGELGDNETEDEFEVESDDSDDEPFGTIEEVEEGEAIELDKLDASPYMQRLFQLPEDTIKKVIGRDDRVLQKTRRDIPIAAFAI